MTEINIKAYLGLFVRLVSGQILCKQFKLKKNTNLPTTVFLWSGLTFAIAPIVIFYKLLCQQNDVNKTYN
jgi:hypothetical protein